MYPSTFGRIIEKETNVCCLNEAANRVDGDEESSVRLEQSVVYPEHRAE